jgi:hypothetical protein
VKEVFLLEEDELPKMLDATAFNDERHDEVANITIIATTKIVIFQNFFIVSPYGKIASKISVFSQFPFFILELVLCFLCMFLSKIQQ